MTRDGNTPAIDAEQLNRILREAPAMICVTRGPDHVIETLNRRFEDSIGSRYVVGLPIREAFQETSVGDLFFDLMDEVFATGVPYHGYQARTMVDEDGDGFPEAEVYSDFVIQPIYDRSSVGGILLHAVDVTAQVLAQRAMQRHAAEMAQSEERLRLALEAGHMGSWEWDLTTNRITWSTPLERIYGLKAGSFGGTVEDFERDIHPEDRDRVLAEIRRTMADTAPHRIEYRIVRRDGAIRWLESRGTIVRDEFGRPERLMGVSLDVTDRRMLLEREKSAREDAQAANRAKDEFLATLSHELRTPLNAILGWVRLMGSGSLDAQTMRHAIEIIERNTRLQAQLIEDLLDVSRIISGKLRLDLRPAAFSSVVEAAIESVRPTADAKRIALEFHSTAASDSVLIDHGRMQQVVWNLLSNALKFTPPRGRVSIELAASESTLMLKVRDTGAGIRSDFLPYVFDRFRQEDAATTRAHGGLGLGLSIVRHLVELHGGSVSVASDGEGRGSTFTVRLPLAPASALTKDYVAARAAVLDELPSLGGIHVLLVEDERDARTLITMLLERQDARVTAVASAAQALAALSREVPDVLLCDIAMPGMDGYELIQRIRAHEEWAALPAAALTAFVSASDRGKALLAGFDTHVPKPVEPSELMAVVAALANRRAAMPPREKDVSSARRSKLH